MQCESEGGEEGEREREERDASSSWVPQRDPVPQRRYPVRRDRLEHVVTSAYLLLVWNSLCEANTILGTNMVTLFHPSNYSTCPNTSVHTVLIDLTYNAQASQGTGTIVCKHYELETTGLIH